MNRKLFGRKLAVLAAGFSLALATAGCVEKIPGNPDKVLEEYILAIQADDLEKVFKLNHLTARQLKYLSQGQGEEMEKSIKENFERHKKTYYSVKPTFHPGISWAERHFFPPGASLKVGKPYSPVAVGDDPVNAEYEKFTSVYVPVEIIYKDKEKAPEFRGRKLGSASYDCGLKKIREGKNVTIYAHDDKWYFGGCLINEEKVTLQE